jgi:hypothetical protein
MNKLTLYTFNSIIEYKKLVENANSENKSIFTCNSDNLKELDYLGDSYIDLSSLIENIRLHPDNIIYFPDDIHFEESSKCIIKLELVKDALKYFYFIFDSTKPLALLNDNEISEEFVPFNRKIIYTYNDEELDDIIKWANTNEVPFIDFGNLRKGTDDNFKLFASLDDRLSFIEISNIIALVKVNSGLLNLFEEIMRGYENCHCIIKQKYAEDALKLFNSLFESENHISSVIDEIEIRDDSESHNKNISKITELSDPEFNDLIKVLNSQLFGHDVFKKVFFKKMKDFRILNKIGISKVFSILLLGDSGVGKTEFARIIKKQLNPGSTFIKVNFGNYGDKNSLSSLIGSPRGYIGSDEGELSIKIAKSKSGIILCDEFEKAPNRVFNFFLELLEDGKFTDSQGEEYNLDGYVIVFTTNLNENEFFERLPKELQSRLDLVSIFTSLNNNEKEDFIRYQFDLFLDKIREHPEFSIDLTELEKRDYLMEIEFEKIDNLREIKRLVHDYILKYIKKSLKKIEGQKTTKSIENF